MANWSMNRDKTLREIVEGIQKVGSIVSEIATSSNEQATGIEEVNRAVVQMDTITQHNAALAEQTSAASEASLSRAQQMNELLGFFSVESYTRKSTGTE